MSAIAGRFNRDGRPVAPASLERLATPLHPGQDACISLWNDDAVALAQQSLRPVAASARDPGAPDLETAGLVLCADAWLDNRHSLGNQLGLTSEQLSETPDSRLIALAYRRWGTHCPAYLVGDFAFAVWDPEQGHLFCARDFVGVRPFYYHVSDKSFSFASELSSLLSLPDIPHYLNLSYLRSLFQFDHFYHPEESFYEDVFKLRPGHTLLVKVDAIQITRYWQPEDIGETRYGREEAYFEHLADLLKQATRDASHTNHLVGSHISGGLDSTTVTVMTARHLRQQSRPLAGFAWAPKPRLDEFPLKDERGGIEEIGLREGITLHYCDLQAADLVRLWMGDITTRPSETLLWERLVASQAEQLGVGVLLSGWGGDEVAAFNGRGYFAALFRRGAWPTLQRELRLQAELQSDSLWNGWRNRVVLPFVPDALLRLLRPHSPQLLHLEPLPSQLQPDFAAQLQRAPLLPRSSEREVPGVRANQINLLLDGHLAKRMESWASAGREHGVTYRYPLLDRRIVEFCLSVPDDLYFKDGWKRYLFRKTVEDLLPPDVVWNKRKADPAMTRHAAALQEAALRQLVVELETSSEGKTESRFVSRADVISALAQAGPSESASGVERARYEDAHRVLWLFSLADSVTVR